MKYNWPDIAVWRGMREMPWNRPFMMKVYLYIVDGLLIDTGPSTLARESSDFFNSHPIQQVALTHIHEDHAGMAAYLQEKIKVPFYLHDESIAEALVEPQLSAYRLNFWGRRPAFKAQPMPDVIKCSRYSFQVIDTPGHHPHHKAFLESEQGWLFSGDLLVTIKPRSVFSGENMSAMISSLEKLDKMDFDTVFCSHTGPRNNGRQVLKEKLDYLLGLKDKVQSLRKQGWHDEEIDRYLFPESSPLDNITEGDFSSLNIVSTL
ncbi:MAG: MBL fold metallo-hydrolase [Syntrophomonadaceae bacterium]|jgi:glyoxylase-like metal-dependent hydrolase (beta-lactamase superfamily II)|nr:MBL fold metallo-hydrolase [Syntrophomonadaceae bacterium]